MVDFRHDVLPIVLRRCADCHGQADSPFPFAMTGDRPMYEHLVGPRRDKSGQAAKGSVVTPGQARTSPLVWHLFGRNTSRPWDAPSAAGPWKTMPPAEAPALTEKEKRTLIEWIDLGALWDKP